MFEILITDKASTTAVFEYHRFCQNDKHLLCFHDANYLCVCEDGHARVDCFGLSSSLDSCSFCFSGGKCLRGDLKNPDDFLCLCPKCSAGRLCQFSSDALGFTPDSLLSPDSYIVRTIYTSFTALLFAVGFFNNACSLATFRRSQPRKFAVAIYLFAVSFLNQLALLFLLFKFIYILGGFAQQYTMNLISCKTISYLLFVFTRSTYWLTSWITCDRLRMILFPSSTTFKNPRIAIGVVAATLLGLGAMHIPDVLYTNITMDKCFTEFDSPLISRYNRINTLLHYLAPFAIQTLSITLLIILAARSRVRATSGNVTFGQVLKKMFNAQKELYVTPAIIIMSALPQTILSFSLACSKLSIWQRHTLLFAYLVSYAPQIFGFILYVLPSKLYRQELKETDIGKTRFFKWLLKDNNKRKTQSTKMIKLKCTK
jgi:hypothetical protein